MWYAIVFAILLAANGPALAQNRPSLTWQGEVTGGATLFIQGNRVDVQGRDTGAVDRPMYRFRDMLPAVAQDVEVRVVRGGGRVNLVEQPSQANQYTAILDIRNNGRPQVYQLEFFWNDDNSIISDRRNDRRNRRGRADDYGYRGRTSDRSVSAAGEVTWSGEVDNEAIITFRGRQAVATAVRGRSVGGPRADFSSPLPRQNVPVNLTNTQGRGRVELMEEPNAGNNYTAKVRVLDSEAGADMYSFTLSWNDGYGPGSSAPGYRSDSGGVLSPSGTPGTYGGGSYTGDSALRWSGRVDGTVRVTVRGSRAWSQRVSGGPVYDERASFGSPLPSRNVGDVDVRKVSGRGDVDVIQRPSASNDYTLVFEIEDKDSGPDFYEVEVNWR